MRSRGSCTARDHRSRSARSARSNPARRRRSCADPRTRMAVGARVAATCVVTSAHATPVPPAPPAPPRHRSSCPCSAASARRLHRRPARATALLARSTAAARLRRAARRRRRPAAPLLRGADPHRLRRLRRIRSAARAPCSARPRRQCSPPAATTQCRGGHGHCKVRHRRFACPATQTGHRTSLHAERSCGNMSRSLVHACRRRRAQTSRGLGTHPPPVPTPATVD